MLNFKKVLCVILVFCVVFSQFSFLFAENEVRNLKGQAQRSFMPPDPNVYPDFYKKGDSLDNEKMQSAAVVDTAVKGSVAEAQKIPAAGSTEKVLVIPIQFQDVHFNTSHNQAYFQNMMTGADNSLKDYFERNSGYFENHSKGITVTATVSPVVTSSYNMEHYGADEIIDSGYDDKYVNIYEMAREAVRLLDAQGFNFSSYDTNSDGTLDHLFIIHAGNGQENTVDIENNLIWSHRWSIYGGEVVDGKTARTYACVSEYSTIGAYCHEFGHDIGLPDLYDADGSLNGYTEGVGDWDLMGAGSWNTLPGEPSGSCPANLSAWSKIYLGWLTPEEIITDIDSKTITNTNGNSTVLRLWPNGNTSSSEYFLAEYRRRANYDAGIPGEGVLVWHIDKTKTTSVYIDSNSVNCYQFDLGIELEQADGKWDLWLNSNRGDNGDPFPGITENYNFINIPYGLRIYNGSPIYEFNYSNNPPYLFTNVELRNINMSGTTASMDCSVLTILPDVGPVLKSPADNSFTGMQPIFSWSVVPRASRYSLQFSENSGFTTILRDIDVNSLSGVMCTGNFFSYQLKASEALNPNKTYYWRVAGTNDFGIKGTWSQTRCMTTQMTYGKYLDKADVPTIRNNYGVVEVNNKIYVIGGWLSGYDCMNTVEEYDPQTNSWSIKTNMPTARENVGIAALNGKIYVVGGDHLSTDWLKTVEEYNPATDTWTRKADMPIGNSKLQLVALNDKLYAIGGQNETKVQEYNPITDTWIVKADLPSRRLAFGAVAYNNKILLVCGYGISEKIVEEYDPITEVCIRKTDSPIGLCNFGMSVINGKLFILGGNEYNQAYSKSLVYDINSDLWLVQDGIYSTLNSLVQVVFNNKIYAFSANDVKEYTPYVPIASYPSNLMTDISENAITLSWDGMPEATGYYISVDNEEIYCPTNTYTHNGLSSNSAHKYAIRAINHLATSEWSNVLTLSTSGSPQFTIDATGITEGNEHAGTINIFLTSGEFRTDGIYNKATVTINPSDLPPEIKQGDVTYIDPTHISISLIGNSTEDYDVNIPIHIKIAKEEITTGRYNDITASGTINATIEPAPSAPDVSFSLTGTDAGRLMGIATSMEYSLNGGVSYTSASGADILLTSNQISNINSVNDIRIRVKANGRVPAGIEKVIDILPSPAAPNITGNDTANTLSGMDASMEFTYDDGTTWIRYNGNNLPDLSGDVNLSIRIPANGWTLSGLQTTLVFTATNPPLSITAVSDGSITEGVENGEEISISLINGQYINPISMAQIQINGLPAGISKGSVIRINNTSITILLSGNSTTDYDTDQVITVSVAPNQVLPSQPIALTTTFVLPATIELQPPVTNVSFSYDGINTGKLMGYTSVMEFSLNGGNTFTSVNGNDINLDASQISTISSANDIKVRIKATLRTPAGIVQTIDILPGPLPPSVSCDDTTNTVSGIDNTLEFSTNGINWTTYNSNLPDLSGNITLMVRKPGIGQTAPGAVSTLTFTVPSSNGADGGGGAPIGGGDGGGGGGFVMPPMFGDMQPVVPVATNPIDEVLKDKPIDTKQAEKVTDYIETISDGLTDEKATDTEKAKAINYAAEKLDDIANIINNTMDEQSVSKLLAGTTEMIDSILNASSKISESNTENVLNSLNKVLECSDELLNAVKTEADKKTVLAKVVDVLETAGKTLDGLDSPDMLTKATSNLIKNIYGIIDNDKSKMAAGDLLKELELIMDKTLGKLGTEEKETISNGKSAKAVLTSKDIENLLSRTDAVIGASMQFGKEMKGSDNRDIETKITIDITKSDNANSVSTTLPAELLSKMQDKDLDKVEISTGIATLAMSPDTFNLGGAESISLEVKQLDKNKDLSPEQKKIVGNNTVYDFNAILENNGGKPAKLSKFNNEIEITIPYILLPGQDPNKITVFFINDNGVLENQYGVYDPVTKTVSFKTGHFSKYMIKENKISFSDLDTNKDNIKYIEAVAINGLMKAKTGDKFKPGDSITRGELAVILVNTFKLGNAADKTVKLTYTDVKAGSSYYGAVALVTKAGLMSSKGKKFNPDTKVTRQELAVALAKALKTFKGVTISSDIKKYTYFTDISKLNAETQKSVAIMVKHNLIVAKKDKMFIPGGTVTRAEMARILYSIMYMNNNNDTKAA